MSIPKLGTKVLNSVNTLVKSSTQSKIIIEKTSRKNVSTCRPILKTLEKDTVQITGKEKISKAAAKTAVQTSPAVFQGSQVSMHHYLNGDNTNIRVAYKAAKSAGPLTKFEKRAVQCQLRTMLDADKEFAKLPPLEKDCIVWRGRAENPIIERFNEDFGIIDKAKIGDIIIPDTGYSYTAFKRELAENWSSPIDGRSMMYKIKLPKGAKVSRNLEHGGEVVMPRNAEYRLLSKTTQGNHTEVELEYILPQKDNVAEVEKLMKKFNL